MSIGGRNVGTGGQKVGISGRCGGGGGDRVTGWWWPGGGDR